MKSGEKFSNEQGHKKHSSCGFKPNCPQLSDPVQRF